MGDVQSVCTKREGETRDLVTPVTPAFHVAGPIRAPGIVSRSAERHPTPPPQGPPAAEPEAIQKPVQLTAENDAKRVSFGHRIEHQYAPTDWDDSGANGLGSYPPECAAMFPKSFCGYLQSGFVSLPPSPERTTVLGSTSMPGHMQSPQKQDVPSAFALPPDDNPSQLHALPRSNSPLSSALAVSPGPQVAIGVQRSVTTNGVEYVTVTLPAAAARQQVQKSNSPASLRSSPPTSLQNPRAPSPIAAQLREDCGTRVQKSSSPVSVRSSPPTSLQNPRAPSPLATQLAEETQRMEKDLAALRRRNTELFSQVTGGTPQPTPPSGENNSGSPSEAKSPGQKSSTALAAAVIQNKSTNQASLSLFRPAHSPLLSVNRQQVTCPGAQANARTPSKGPMRTAPLPQQEPISSLDGRPSSSTSTRSPDAAPISRKTSPQHPVSPSLLPQNPASPSLQYATGSQFIPPFPTYPTTLMHAHAPHPYQHAIVRSPSPLNARPHSPVQVHPPSLQAHAPVPMRSPSPIQKRPPSPSSLHARPPSVHTQIFCPSPVQVRPSSPQVDYRQSPIAFTQQQHFIHPGWAVFVPH